MSAAVDSHKEVSVAIICRLKHCHKLVGCLYNDNDTFWYNGGGDGSLFWQFQGHGVSCI